MLKSTKHPLWFYRVIKIGLSPLLLGYTIYRSFKDGGVIYFQQRLGFKQPELTNSFWFHCASVGEVNTAIDVIKIVREKQQQIPIVISTNTPTAKTVVCKYSIPNLHHCFLPLDYRPFIKKTVQALKPSSLLVMETEIWPELFQHCSDQSIKIVLYNARLTEKTTNTYKWAKKIYRHSIKLPTLVLAKSEQEKARFLELGADPYSTVSVGSLKFSNLKERKPFSSPIIDRHYWLAASTHNDEELRICKVWQSQNRNELLVIAPRYPERRNKLMLQISKLGLTVELRSQSSAPHKNTQIYIVDTFGELQEFISKAKLVFVGGSLIKRGGQNIIEPAQNGVAVLVGPSISNFESEFSDLKAADAILQADDEYVLIDKIVELLDNPQKAKSIGNAAKDICAQQAHIADAYYRLLSPLL